MEAVSKMARRAFPRAAPVGPAATDSREAVHAAVDHGVIRDAV